MEESHSFIGLPFGEDQQTAALPPGFALDLLAPLGPADLPGPRAALFEVLQQPIGSQPLSRRLPRTGQIVLVLPGQPCPGVRELVMLLLSFFAVHRIGPERVHLLFVRPDGEPPADPEALVGAELLRACPYFHSGGEYRLVGQTRSGTSVSLDARLWDYDLILPVAPAVFHPFAGVTGAEELIVPGLAAAETLRTARTLSGRLEPPPLDPGPPQPDEPLREELSQAARLLALPVFTVLFAPGSAPGKFVGFFAGTLARTREAALQTLVGWRCAAFEAPYSLVLSATGLSSGVSDLPEVCRGILLACRLSQPGGHVIHLADCHQDTSEAVLRALAGGPWLGLREELFRAIRREAGLRTVQLVSAVNPALLESLGLKAASSLSEALGRALAALPPDPLTVVLPDVGNSWPVQGAPRQGPSAQRLGELM